MQSNCNHVWYDAKYASTRFYSFFLFFQLFVILIFFIERPNGNCKDFIAAIFRRVLPTLNLDCSRKAIAFLFYFSSIRRVEKTERFFFPLCSFSGQFQMLIEKKRGEFFHKNRRKIRPDEFGIYEARARKRNLVRKGKTNKAKERIHSHQFSGLNNHQKSRQILHLLFTVSSVQQAWLMATKNAFLFRFSSLKVGSWDIGRWASGEFGPPVA